MVMMLKNRQTTPDAKLLGATYELRGELGRGGMAVVYRGRERATGLDVAIKVISPRYAEDQEAISRFAREARTLAHLQHPNIVPTYAIRDLGRQRLALVMPFVPGRTLRQALREDGPFTFERTGQVLRDIAQALRHAHSHGVVHRDVKPENIFLHAESGRALLSDFGSARLLDAETQLTRTGVAIGTPTYMSPEQVDGAQVDGRSDLYSLGLVGWEMLTGIRPWEGQSLYAVLYKQKNEELPRLTELRPGIPERLLFAIESALDKHRDTRWANADEFLTQLVEPEPSTASRSGVSPSHAFDFPSLKAREPEQRGPAVGRSLLPVPQPGRVRLRRTLRLVLSFASAAGVVAVASVVSGGSRPGASDGYAAARPTTSAAENRGSDLDLETDLARAIAAGGSAAVRDSAAPALRPARRRATSPAVRPSSGRTHADSLQLCDSPLARDQRACLFARVADGDVELNRVYGELVAELRRGSAGSKGAGSAEVSDLRSRQRAWLVRRDAECRRRGRGLEGTLWAPVWARCLAEFSARRTKELAEALRSFRRE